MIELLTVVVIIATLAAIAVPSFLGQRNRANEASEKADATTTAVYESGGGGQQSVGPGATCPPAYEATVLAYPAG